MKIQTVRYILVFLGLPMLLWSLGNFYEDTILKESLSVLVIIAFSFMIGQFFLARSFKVFLKEIKMPNLVKFHKTIGYLIVSVILLHPFFIIFPRYFEAGIEPKEAFITMVTTFDSVGILLGISAWTLMLILGLTSYFRDRLGLSYRSWRVFHGILSIVFISLASLHVLDLGSHINTSMSIFILATASSGIVFLLNLYIFETKNKKNLT